MNKVKLLPYKTSFELVEIFQSMSIKFALLNKDLLQVTSPAKCRDFIGDCIWSYKTNEEAHIYGFKYNFKKNPYDLEATRISLTFPNDTSKNNFIKNFSWLTDLEKKYDLKESIIEEADMTNTLIITGDKVWMTTPWKISLYTYFHKLLSYKSKDELDEPEKKYARILTDENLAKFMSAIHNNFYNPSDSIRIQHNQTGFVSIMNNTAGPELCKAIGF